MKKAYFKREGVTDVKKITVFITGAVLFMLFSINAAADIRIVAKGETERAGISSELTETTETDRLEMLKEDDVEFFQFLGKNRTEIEQIFGEPHDVNYDDMNYPEIIAVYDTDMYYGVEGSIGVHYYDDYEGNYDSQYAFCVRWQCEGQDASYDNYQETLDAMKELIGETDEFFSDGTYEQTIWRSDEDYGGLNDNLEERNLKIVAIDYHYPEASDSEESSSAFIGVLCSNTVDI